MNYDYFLLNMLRYEVPVALARQLDHCFEFRTPGSPWLYAALDRFDQWVSSDGVVGHLRNTVAIRCPQPLVRFHILKIVEAINEGVLDLTLPHEIAFQNMLSYEATRACEDLLPEKLRDFDHQARDTRNRIRRELIVDALYLIEYSQPASQIAVGFGLFDDSDRLVEEFGTLEDAVLSRDDQRNPGANRIGIVFADGSSHPEHPLVDQLLELLESEEA